jgi:hypothetical protein
MICKIKLYGRSTYKYINPTQVIKIDIDTRKAILVSVVTERTIYYTTNMPDMQTAEKEADRLMSILNGAQDL